ncbi:hypothetical protein Anapl_17126 [Anas platyrhynchos]|uniref:Uncharacterized protein n=1 Tax=Anas platyrhynchos TaxID=8839 RepID=R0K572_ANAPL|nr:hypothetical protein Anapl_17126 [Anas platyrhynchos]
MVTDYSYSNNSGCKAIENKFASTSGQESTSVERDVLILTGSVEKCSGVTVHLSTEMLRNSEDLASREDAEGNAQEPSGVRVLHPFNGDPDVGGTALHEHPKGTQPNKSSSQLDCSVNPGTLPDAKGVIFDTNSCMLFDL